MGLIVAKWGGGIYGATSGGTQVEEWSNSLSMISDGGANAAGVISSVASAIVTWFNNSSTAIHPTVALEYIDVNDVDVATGHQINDPTLTVPESARGAGASSITPPLSVAYRVSIDNGTRDRSARGGFYVPRPALAVQANGRFNSSPVLAALGTATDMFDAINAITGVTVGVWSRKNHSVTASTRARVGDVPDNVRRRRNELVETYTSGSIAP